MIWLIVFIVVTIVVVGLLLYWQLILTEGAYLGAPLVALLYDWTAERYDKIKAFDPETESLFVGQPLANRLHRQPEGMVLDVATGTGRVPQTLLGQSEYRGRIVALDRASKMLTVARRDTACHANRLTFIQADAMALPFAADTFPAVSCLEALEFLPDPRQGLAELVRVLQPATIAQPDIGWLLITQRVGWEARLMPGKTWSKKALLEILQGFPLQRIQIRPWEDIYNLVWAKRSFEQPGNDRQQDTQDNADNNHTGDRRVKAKARSLHADVAGKMAEPTQFVPQKPHPQANHHQDQAN